MNTKRPFDPALDARFVGLHYAILQALYWMLQCGYYAFGVSYLSARGLHDGITGVLLALIGGASALTQTLIAAAADRGGRLGPKGIAVLLMAPVCALLLLLTLAPCALWLHLLCYAVVWVLVMDVQFLLSTMSMDYAKAGVIINFGACRACGSVCYALSAYALGVICARAGVRITIPIAAGVGLLFLAALLLWREPPRELIMDETETQAAKLAPSAGFLQRYPRFGLFIVGCSLCLIAYSMTCSYMVRIVEALGGGSRELGTTVMITALCEAPTLLISMRLNKRFGSSKLMCFSAVMLSVKMLAITLAWSVPVLYVCELTQLFSYSLFIPGSVYYVDALMQKRDRLKGQAMMTLVLAVGSAAGSLFGGFLIERFAVRGMLLVCMGISLIGTGVMIAGVDKKMSNE